MHNFKELIVWKESMRLAKTVYVLCLEFPADERFGLTTQIKRCAVSIPSNIAEGAGRNSDKDFLRFLSLSTGSIFELETQLLLASDLGFVDLNKVNTILADVAGLQKKLYRFSQQLESKVRPAIKS
jgi:four helix bundle protein